MVLKMRVMNYFTGRGNKKRDVNVVTKNRGGK